MYYIKQLASVLSKLPQKFEKKQMMDHIMGLL